LDLRRRLPAWAFIAMALGVIALCALIEPYCAAAPGEDFRITVIDQATGRGVPLVKLRTDNAIRFYTDSNGVVAISDPDLINQTIYFHVSSPGYEYPKDGFGYAGIALHVVPGGSATIKIKRDNIAERLYRMTGAGIYADSVRLGLPVPLPHPLLDGQVMGQDTVEVTPYRGKIYWFFGDTKRPSYPLGQFATSGATSLLPGHGGLNPSVGVNLDYWVDSTGFSRPMIPLPHASGPIWVGGLFTMPDQGQTHLFTNFAEVDKNMSPTLDGLAEFNDTEARFIPVCFYPKGVVLRPEGHPFLAAEAGQSYLYFQPTVMGAFPLVRVRPVLADLKDPSQYESFTCLKPGTFFQGANTQLDRAPDGHLLWGWKKDTAALGEDQANTLVKAGKMQPDELLTSLHDVDTDQVVLSDGGSVFWNPYRQRWIMITTQAFGTPSFLGEVWFSEADTPVGPWLYAKKIATHGGYTFYNPTQLPFFDQKGGRLIYFQGTYTNTFSNVTDLTPRYNYNQLMYRLDLSDPRLSLPEPVYRLKQANGRISYGMREQVAPVQAWDEIQSIPFYAVPGSRSPGSLIPIYSVPNSAGGSLDQILQTDPPSAGSSPFFFALPPTPSAGEKPAPDVVPLYEYSDPQTGRHWYSTDAEKNSHAARSAQPLCRVWRNPSSVVALDSGAVAINLPQ
jgi:hypothetical protein